MTSHKPRTVPIAIPPVGAPLAADLVATGLPVPAIDRLRLMSASEWEDFVGEWVDSLRADYSSVERHAGAGDMGCDVVALHKNDERLWDNFQCKHYNRVLYPSDIWVELGKVIYYSYVEEYSYPSAYQFVAPHGAGPSLLKLLRKPAELKQQLREQWEQHCTDGIRSEPTPLTAQLDEYIEKLDFSIFSCASPLNVIEAHSKTRWHAARFGGGLPPRPEADPPPVEIADEEIPYVGQLLAAYSDHLGAAIPDVSTIGDTDLAEHFQDSRVEFYSAESLRLFSRETLPPGAYGKLQLEVLDGVKDELRSAHDDAYAKVLAVVKTAKGLPLANHPLGSRILNRDRGGICHQLVNEDRMRWVK